MNWDLRDAVIIWGIGTAILQAAMALASWHDARARKARVDLALRPNPLPRAVVYR